jgi:hypothetical protein
VEGERDESSVLTYTYSDRRHTFKHVSEVAERSSNAMCLSTILPCPDSKHRRARELELDLTALAVSRIRALAEAS